MRAVKEEKRFWQSNFVRLMCVIILPMTLLAACAGDPKRRTKIGAGVGAVIGGVIGHQVDEDDGAVIGAVVGAVAGGAVGNYMDQQQAALEKELAEEAARQELRITRMPGDALRVGVASDASFDSGSAELKGQAQTTFAKIASILKDYDKTIVHVVGHTDSDGSDVFNENLSNKRANAVYNFMGSQGLQFGRMKTEGRGEREPVASNATPEGKRRNRRVDIVIKPVVEGREQEAYQPPPYLGA